jgi:hypothetical protein
MAQEVKLEPGWLTRDVKEAATRAKSLEAASRKVERTAPATKDGADSKSGSEPTK